MNFMMELMIIMSTMFLMSEHPISFMLVIIAQSCLICLTTFIMNMSSWFSFILFLIFLGGMMVLFIYIVSLAPNEKFEFNMMKNSKIIILASLLMGSMFFHFYFEKSEKMLNPLMETVQLIFSSNLFIITFIIMNYLLFTLVVAVKISSKIEGALRNFIK